MTVLADRVRQWATSKNLLAIGLIGLFAILTTAAAYFVLPYHSDWGDCFRPASLALWSLQGETYRQVISACHMNYGPWIVAALLPVAILPAQISRAIYFALSIAGYAIVITRLGAKPIATIAFLLSYPVVYGLLYGQVDWLVSTGFLLSPPLGIIILLAKPQVGVGVIIFWFFEAWRQNRWSGVVKTAAPALVVMAVTYLLLGNWMAGVGNPLTFGAQFANNISLWPRSIPFGLIFLVYAIRERKQHPAIIASPLLSPHVSTHTWASGLLGLAPDTLLCVIACAATWVVWALGGGAPNG